MRAVFGIGAVPMIWDNFAIFKVVLRPKKIILFFSWDFKTMLLNPN